MTQISGESAAFPAQTHESPWYAVAKVGALYLLAIEAIRFLQNFVFAFLSDSSSSAVAATVLSPWVIGLSIGLTFVFTRRRLGAYITYGIVGGLVLLSAGVNVVFFGGNLIVVAIVLNAGLNLAVMAAIIVGMRSLATGPVQPGVTGIGAAAGVPAPFQETASSRERLPLWLGMGGAILGSVLGAALSLWAFVSPDALGYYTYVLEDGAAWLVNAPALVGGLAGVALGATALSKSDAGKLGRKEWALAAVWFGGLSALDCVASLFL